jgi:hypothetical protein
MRFAKTTVALAAAATSIMVIPTPVSRAEHAISARVTISNDRTNSSVCAVSATIKGLEPNTFYDVLVYQSANLSYVLSQLGGLSDARGVGKFTGQAARALSNKEISLTILLTDGTNPKAFSYTLSNRCSAP